jgi:hypothetical protein
VLDDVRQRLGDDEVRGHLDIAGQPPRGQGGHVEVHRYHRRGDQRVDPGPQTAAGQSHRQDAVHDVAQFHSGPFGVLERLPHQIDGVLAAVGRVQAELQ